MDDPFAAVMMTLAGLAYGSPARIPSYLAEDRLTDGVWKIGWIADQQETPVNFAFIARNTQTRAYAIAIRGTYPNPLSSAYWDDAAQDSPTGPMQDWPYSPGSGAQISGGSWTGFSNLLTLPGGGMTFEQAVAAIPAGSTVFVTGHSLGGTLSPVVGLWLTTLPGSLVVNVYGFAGMTPGNAAFAALFGAGTPLAGRVRRFANTLDTVPYGWDDVLGTVGFYAPAPRGGPVVEAAVALMALRLATYGYTAVGETIWLTGQLQPITIGCEFVAYVLENLHQHMPDTYLGLLGAPSLPFTIGFGAVVAKRTEAEASLGSVNQLPVYYDD